MKNSTILIVVGIIIMIVGGIVFMNNEQTKNSAAPKKGSVESAYEAVKLYDSPSKGQGQPLSVPVIMLAFGAVALIAGFYDARHKPTPGNIQPPGPT